MLWGFLGAVTERPQFPYFFAVPAELEPLQPGAVGGDGGNQVLELDLQGDPLSCSDRKYTQVLQAKIEGFTYTVSLTISDRIHKEDVFTL